MRRRFAFCALMISLMFLTGCAGGAGKTVKLIGSKYATGGSITSRVAVTVELGDKTQDYVLDWTSDGGTSRVTIAEPESVKGVEATSSDGGLTLEYGGTSLSLSGLGAIISPVQALPAMLFGWSGGLLTQYCMDDYDGVQAFYAEYDDGREGMDLTQRVWFDAERLTPLYAEVYSDGSLAMTCEFLTFIME